jgi:hypothetical protein
MKQLSMLETMRDAYMACSRHLLLVPVPVQDVYSVACYVRTCVCVAALPCCSSCSR